MVRLCMEKAEDVRCKGSMDHVLAPPTFHDIKFHISRWSNDPSFKKYHAVANKFHPLSHCHVTANVNIRCRVTVGSKTKLPSIVKEEDKLLRPCKKSKQAITHASTIECSFICLVLSYSNVYATSKSKHFPGTLSWRLRMEAG